MHVPVPPIVLFVHDIAILAAPRDAQKQRSVPTALILSFSPRREKGRSARSQQLRPLARGAGEGQGEGDCAAALRNTLQ